MKYPYVSNTIRVESENENEVQIYNFITDYHLTLNREDYDFLMKLDGNTDPYSLSNDREYVEDFMEFLESERLIRTSRFLVALPSIYFALWSPKENGWLQKHAPFLNRCILILVPICLYLGIRHFKYGDFGSAPVYFSGFILGAICGKNRAGLTLSIAKYAAGVNDNVLIKDALRYTINGPGTPGSSGGSLTSTQFRIFDTSYVGRVDLYQSSNSDPGVSGCLTPTCKIDMNNLVFTKDV
jgi:hypothetical protein